MTKITKKDKLTYVEVFIAFILFTITIYSTKENFHISFSAIIGLLLYLMIYIELVRAMFDFIFGDEHKFKVRYIYDMGIMFLIREILVTMAANHYTIEKEITFLTISSIILVLLFGLRIIDAKVFKYTENCENCIYTFKNK
jgi:uncharacterized membrane protein (DUF373 family)